MQTDVLGSDFDPAVAGLGTTTITYTYEDANGCVAEATTDIVVNPLPTPDAGTYGPLCIDNGLEPLVGTPAGGIFSGTGVVGGSFDPAVAGVGTTTITYVYADANGCEAEATTDIVVNPLPTRGTGVVGSDFDPAVAGAGTTTITYTYTDANGCSAEATTDIVVNPLPTPDAGMYGPVCLDNGLVALWNRSSRI